MGNSVKIPKHVKARFIGKLSELAVKQSLLRKHKQPDSIIIERKEGDYHYIPVVRRTIFGGYLIPLPRGPDRTSSEKSNQSGGYLIPPPWGRLWFVLSGGCYQKINEFTKKFTVTGESFDELKRAEKFRLVLRIFELISLCKERKVDVEKIEEILESKKVETENERSSANLTASQVEIIRILGESSQKRSVLCRKLDLKRSTLANYLRGLKEKGWIAETGDRKDPLCVITLRGKEFLDDISLQTRNLRNKRIYIRDIKQTGINTDLFKDATCQYGEISYQSRRRYLKGCVLVAKLNLMEELTPMKRAYERYHIGRHCRPDFSVFEMNGTVNVYEVKARTSKLSSRQRRCLNKLGSKSWIKTYLIHTDFDFPEDIQIEILKINNLP